MAELSLNNVYDISVSAAGAGVGEFNTSNIAILTHEAFGASFGNAGYKIYVDPTQGAADFGTSSITARMLNSIFSQRPNIRANSGYVVVIPMLSESQGMTYPAAPTAGTFVLNIGAGATAPVNWNDSAAQIQTKIRAIGPEYASVAVTGDAATGFTFKFSGVEGDVPTMTVSANTLVDAGTDPVVPAITTSGVAETPVEALVRAEALVQFFAAIYSFELDEAELVDVAEALAPMRKIGLFLGSAQEDVEDGGKLDLLRSGSFRNSRGLLRIGNTAEEVIDGVVFVAAYAGRAFSTNFSGSNTTQTMHLKDLVGVQPDAYMTQNILDLAQEAGADVYASFRGVPKTYTSGANMFFDQIYNQLWYVEALQVALFNTLAQSSSKIPQTESGMDVLKASARRVSEQAVTNQYAAPGTWTDPTTFGDLGDFLDNISQRGYYIYSQPIAQQSVAQREARVAPLMQIALKEAGAIHSGNVLININP